MKKLLFFFFSFAILCGTLRAQPSTPTGLPMQDGYAIATCFSGNNTGQNPSNPVLVIMNVRDANAIPLNTNWGSPNLRFDNPGVWIAKNMGEIFGIAENTSGDIFVTATTVYGGPTATTNYAWGGIAGGGPGSVYRINGVTGSISLFATLPNQNGPGIPYPGLGNICYDSKHNQFFVTDLEDGKIYRLNGSTGAILSTFDPFTPDGGSPGFCPLGERLWGIGYFNDSVYFSRWNQDGGNPGGQPNQVWSVGLNSVSGAFVGSEHLDFNIPALAGAGYSNPVADIEFSQSGNMLLAERVWYGTAAAPLLPTANLGGWAHQARLLEYKLVGGVWTAEPVAKYKVGTIGNNTNASGGCDWGYQKYDSTVRPGMVVNCDSEVWVSADAIHFGNPDIIYGFQGLPESGGSITNSVLIDADNITNKVDKNQIGDFDIYKHCVANVKGCVQHSIIPTPIQTPDKRSCCYRLKLNAASAVYTSLTADVLTAGVTIVGVTGPSGWGTANTGMLATWTPPGGIIPAGTTDSLQFCIFSLTNPPQVVAFTWYNADGTRCYDTLRFDCPRSQPPVPSCVQVDSSTVTCKNQTANGTSYQWTFTFTNVNAFHLPAYNLGVSSGTPGVTVSPSNVTLPGLPYNSMSAPIPLTIQVPTGFAGTSVCIVFHLKGQLVDSAGNCVWSCPCDTVCITLPKCKDCCDNFHIGIDGKPPFWNGTNVVLNQTVNVTPGPVMSMTATIVSASQTAVCPGRPKVTRPVFGLITGGTVNPSLPPPSFSPASGTATWGTSSAGVNVTSLALNLQFPPPPANRQCFDTLNFCIQYSFTDTACHTCQKTVCYQVVRRTRGIDQSNGTVNLNRNETELTSGGPGKTDGSKSIQQFERVPLQLASIVMTSESAGTLTIAIPPSIDPLDVYSVIGLQLQGSAGAVLTGLKDDQSGTSASIVDQVASLVVQINNGEKRTFSLTYNNVSSLTAFANTLTLKYTVPGTVDTSRSVFTVLARTPNGMNGDSVGVDAVTPAPPGVRTYAVYISNGNKTQTPISRVRLKVNGGERLLAAGPFGDSSSVLLRTCLDGQNKLLLVPSSFAEDTLFVAGVVVKPIYLTISGATQNSVSVHYTTLDSLGNTISEGDVTLSNPLSTVHSENKPMAAPDSYLLPVYPNPASRSVSVQFHLMSEDYVSLTVTDAGGRTVGSIVASERLMSGDHVFVFPTESLPSGHYFVTLKTSRISQTQALEVIH